MKKIWDFLNGNKTIIGTFILLLLQEFGDKWFSQGFLEVLIWLIVTLTSASLAHHVKKQIKKK